MVVDIGGGYGDFMKALSKDYPDIRCICLDLPHVIQDAPLCDSIELVSGDMFDVSTIPPCDAIIMKHVLCDWSDEDAIRILKNCYKALPSDGIVLLLDALLSSGDDLYKSHELQVYIDALLLVVGGRMERSRFQLSHVAEVAGFQIDKMIATDSPSVNITVLSKLQ